jgi:uncharacterized secreted protein with C-terminal beta-propeller domain
MFDYYMHWLNQYADIFYMNVVKAYVVTYENTDPFIIVDLQNPKDPKVVGELKVGPVLCLHALVKLSSSHAYM